MILFDSYNLPYFIDFIWVIKSQHIIIYLHLSQNSSLFVVNSCKTVYTVKGYSGWSDPVQTRKSVNIWVRFSPIQSKNILSLEFRVWSGIYRAIRLFGFFRLFQKITCHYQFYRFNTCEFSLKNSFIFFVLKYKISLNFFFNQKCFTFSYALKIYYKQIKFNKI